MEHIIIAGIQHLAYSAMLSHNKHMKQYKR